MNNPKANIKLNYLYRDAENFKINDSLIYSNPNKREINNIQEIIKTSLKKGELFSPNDWNIPPLMNEEIFSESDHELHEFGSVEETDETYKSMHTIDYLLELVCK